MTHIKCKNCGGMIEITPYGAYAEHLKICTCGYQSKSEMKRVEALKANENPLSNIKRLVPKGMLGTVDTVIDDLVDVRNDIAEIYVCVKLKDGSSDTYLSGKLDGLTFAMLMFQDKALEALNGK